MVWVRGQGSFGMVGLRAGEHNMAIKVLSKIGESDWGCVDTPLNTDVMLMEHLGVMGRYLCSLVYYIRRPAWPVSCWCPRPDDQRPVQSYRDSTPHIQGGRWREPQGGGVRHQVPCQPWAPAVVQGCFLELHPLMVRDHMILYI